MPNGVLRRGALGPLLVGAAAVVGGTLFFSALARPRVGVPGAGTRRPPPGAPPQAPGQAPVPTQPGVVIKKGGYGAFIPINFDRVVSDIFSIFTPSRSEAAGLDLPTAPTEPVPEFAVAETTEGLVNVGADGSILTADDFGAAGADWWA